MEAKHLPFRSIQGTINSPLALKLWADTQQDCPAMAWDKDFPLGRKILSNPQKVSDAFILWKGSVASSALH